MYRWQLGWVAVISLSYVYIKISWQLLSVSFWKCGFMAFCMLSMGTLYCILFSLSCVFDFK